MPKLESIRTTAEAIGRITCIKTGEDIGLLYQWDNGETQAALFGSLLTGQEGTTSSKKRSKIPADIAQNQR